MPRPSPRVRISPILPFRSSRSANDLQTSDIAHPDGLNAVWQRTSYSGASTQKAGTLRPSRPQTPW